MIVIIAFLSALQSLLRLLTTAYLIVIVARAVISWMPMDPWHPFVRLVVNLTEPVLGRVRKLVNKIIPLTRIGIDITPMLVILVLFFIYNFVDLLLSDLIMQLKG